MVALPALENHTTALEKFPMITTDQSAQEKSCFSVILFNLKGSV
jgi:hypothetical protein